MNKIIFARRWFMHTALSYLGKPYIWGGDDPSGFDCSGLIVECLKTAGLLSEKEDLTANLLLKRYQQLQTESPSDGCLLFWINTEGRAYHVAICLDKHFQISAAGGNVTTIGDKEAWRQNAFVRIRPIGFSPSRHVIVDPFRNQHSIPE